MYISITGLQTKGFISAIRFWRFAIPSFRQAQIASGNTFCQTKTIQGHHCTLTAWESREHMLQYLRSGTHLKAMQSFHKIAHGKTYGFESDAIPDWNEAFLMLQEKGKMVGI